MNRNLFEKEQHIHTNPKILNGSEFKCIKNNFDKQNSKFNTVNKFILFKVAKLNCKVFFILNHQLLSKI